MFREWRTRTWLRLKALSKRRQLDRDLDDEIAFHLAMREQKLAAGNSAPENAHYTARRRFGNTTSLKEVTREMWTFVWLENLLQDGRFAFRMFTKRPGYAAALILILALGIGGTSTIFTIVNGVLLEPLPYKNPDRIVSTIGMTVESGTDPFTWWRQAKSFEELAVYQSGGVNFTTATNSTRVPCTVVSSGFFGVFQVNALLGRTFIQDDAKPEHNQVAILSFPMWRNEFAADPNIIGKVIQLNEKFYTVVGVMPQGFGYPAHTSIWVPRSSDYRVYLDIGSDVQRDAGRAFATIGRLREGATVPEANVELKHLLQSYEEMKRKTQANYGSGLIGATPLKYLLVRDYLVGLVALLGAVTFLLLIACVNAAQMILARAAARQKEVAVRLCLGASRARILRQMLTESTVITMAAGAGGILIAYLGLKLTQLLGPKDIPRLADVRLDWRVLGFAFGLSLVIGILVGLAPALQTMAQDLTGALKQESSRATGFLRKGLRAAMVIGEVALTLILLLGAALMIKSLNNLMRTSPGFQTQNVITMEYSLPPAPVVTNAAAKHTNQKLTDAAQLSAFAAESKRVEIFNHTIASAITQLPGVISAGAVDKLPLGGKAGSGLFVDLGNKVFKFAHGQSASGDYFQSMGIPILEGRTFSETDSQNQANVIVISNAMARAFWPGEDPLGKPVMLEQSGPDRPPREIIGVVGDVKFYGLGDDPAPVFYLPAQHGNLTLVVRTTSDPRGLVKNIRETFSKIAPDVPLYNVRTMSEVVADSTSAPRFRGAVVGIFAALALVLAVFGLYSVVAYSVTSRTHELGVRMALGAQPRDILAMITRDGMWLALAGIAIGALGSFWVTKLIASLLYEVKPTDPATLIFTAIVLVAGTTAACILPARRASRIDPSSALRYE
jgi:putative ABC transport system permease protein